ncbi:SSI family serine proteinase inhibitor [Stackebrandtia nassauensis]|uniref:Proteinase inhibitor I16 subtilisin-type inhibitor n=1 Tax=Stackebrandtia nassauensis (strain DSM 44728 / CIP 108903 / NRRL B-16338 / NBRC 102104 / LLR-40K-21) TaxID=446470 RepID=D3Q080_STANL|nr:SSI family serine proteinase inhibitor [Stackebrandtia nassauensis]ADD45609.1 proteinase inhibitor I16 subtilisin-type inhibitor [Stackebrandtia nassauensis DSM 44728]
MTRTATRLAGAVVLTAGLLAVPAAASASAVDTVVEGHYSLKLTPKQGASISYDLSCTPDGGSHPNTAAACEDLDAADGHVTDIPAQSGPCTKEFAPVVAIAKGVWDGGERSYEQEFSNECEAVARTGGAVFDFS